MGSHFTKFRKTSGYITILLLLFATFSCDEKQVVTEYQTTTYSTKDGDVLFRSVSTEDYAKASPLEKRLISQLDAAVNALDILSAQNTKIEYEAIISVSKDIDNKFSNTVILAPISGEKGESSLANARIAAGGSCHVCGLGDAMECIKKVEKYMDSTGKNEITATVKRSGKCVDINYQ